MSDTTDVDKEEVIDAQAPKTKFDKEQQEAIQDYGRPQANGQLNMNVKVYSPFHDYYDGPAFSLTAENATGPFDILPKHHSFISLLDPCDLVIRTEGEGEQKIRIG